MVGSWKFPLSEKTMRKIYLFILFLITLCFVGCTSRQEHESSIISSAREGGISISQEDIITECELDSCEGEELVGHKNEVLEVFKQANSKMPKHKKLLQEELTSWESYYQALKEVGCYSEESWNHYYYGVLEQGVDLLETSLKYIDENEAPKRSKNRFTSQMIDKAYEAMLDSTTWNDYQRYKGAEYRKALKEEYIMWNKWMSCRERLSAVLSGKTKETYDECTNHTMRLKLLQLKNQNQGLGVISNDIMNCLLPDNCIDADLLSYPGFDKVWAKHLENPDWKPVFEN